MAHSSYWQTGVSVPEYPVLDRDLTVDVAVIGGGITGITAAYLLKKAGVKVALFERGRCGQRDTGHTTAHLTHVTDLRLGTLVKNFGKDHAQAFWEAGDAAISQIESRVEAEEIECEFQRVPGFLLGSLKRKEPTDEGFSQEADLAREMGFHGEFVESVPVFGEAGVRYSNQAKFHPLKYLAGLLKAIEGDGSFVFENSEVKDFSDKPLGFKCRGHKVECGQVVIATHVPLMGNEHLLGATLFQTKLALYSSYAIGVKLPRGTAGAACFWDTSDPYYYLRVENYPTHDYAIFGGEDCKTGQEAKEFDPYGSLQKVLAKYVPINEVDKRWMGQVVETFDGLPLIGAMTENQFVATGFSGNGMTLGSIAAEMACDAVMKRKNPWQDFFDVRRKKILGGAWDYIKENVDYPYYLVRDHLRQAEAEGTASIGNGEGKIVKMDGQKVAAYRNRNGNLVTLSPVCTHMGCIVKWNGNDQTWDCPCHGSRFKPTGEVIGGPAETPLKQHVAKDEKK